jgi:hypothetical protein
MPLQEKSNNPTAMNRNITSGADVGRAILIALKHLFFGALWMFARVLEITFKAIAEACQRAIQQR